jgi:hypothetical protein
MSPPPSGLKSKPSKKTSMKQVACKLHDLQESGIIYRSRRNLGSQPVNLALLGNQGQPIGDGRKVTMFGPLMGRYGYGKHGVIEVVIIRLADP